MPGSFDVLGRAQSNATVTVNNLATYRKGDYFWKELSVNNSSSAIYTNVSVVGVKNLVGTNQEDAVTTVAGNEFVPKTPEVYGYDLDGNLTQDGRWTCTWDGENRLIAMESLTNAPSASKKKLEFAYDHQSRRISKKVSNWNGSSYVLTNALLCVYDQWNLQAELDAFSPQPSALRTYTWGLDLSGSEHGAGGVGGLLRITNYESPITNSFVAYDGNGNVMKLVKASDGSIAGEYEYDAYGGNIRASGIAANAPMRFSSKYEDKETGSLYYGYRYASSAVGRWLNRDPMADHAFVSLNSRARRLGSRMQPDRQASLQLYAFLWNDALRKIDPVGLEPVCSSGVWQGQVAFKAFTLVLVYGSFSGNVQCRSDPTLTAKIAGSIHGAGVQFGFIKGDAKVAYAAETKADLVGLRGGVFVGSFCLGLGPINIAGVSGAVSAAHMPSSGNTDFTGGIGSFEPPGISSDFNLWEITELLKFKYGPGVGVAFLGLEIKSAN